ncbi:MAG: cytochrome c3 family protein [Prolixibacteraceae bacterium]
MSIIFSELQKYRFSPKVFLLILSFSFFDISTMALPQTQGKRDSVKAAADSQASKAGADSVINTGAKGQAETASADTTGTAAKDSAAGADTTGTAVQTSPPDSASADTGGHSTGGHLADNLKRGERFFLGLLPHGSEQPSCVSCHNLVPSDTLNWNPSAADIANKYIEKDFAAFQAVVMQPAGGKMAEVHQGYQFEEADLKSMKAYLDDLSMRGPVAQKPDITRLLLFIFLSLIVVWALLELIVFHKVKYKAVPLVIFLLVFGYQVKIVYDEGVRLGRSPEYEPAQPIKFSHKVHAGQNQIDCKYCHFTAEDSKTAGIPPGDLCLNCHSLVREGKLSGQFEIAKVIEANEKQKPIEWIRVHDLPDHVFFSHAQHVNAGKLDCMECHGDVARMDVVRQVEDLSMGWCLDCHRTKEVQFTSNNFYGKYEKLHEQIKKGEIDKVTVDMIGGTDCMKCHY